MPETLGYGRRYRTVCVRYGLNAREHCEQNARNRIRYRRRLTVKRYRHGPVPLSLSVNHIRKTALLSMVFISIRRENGVSIGRPTVIEIFETFWRRVTNYRRGTRCKNNAFSAFPTKRTDKYSDNSTRIADRRHCGVYFEPVVSAQVAAAISARHFLSSAAQQYNYK